MDCVSDYKASAWFKNACAAERYMNGITAITERTKSKMQAIKRGGKNGEMVDSGQLVEVPMNQISTKIYGRLVTQRIQYLFQNGMNLDKDKKNVFGIGIDREIERAAKNATVHGESYLMWNVNKAVCYKAASANGLSGMFFLLDEMTATPMLGIRFFQLSSDKPMTMMVYYADGFEMYGISDDEITLLEPMRGYITRIRRDALGEQHEYAGYGMLPFAVFKANEDGDSTFTVDIKSKIDAYDVITSDFADNLERMEGIYWAIKNFGGTTDEAKAMLAELETLHVAMGQSDAMGGEMDARPQSIEAPYAAREFALKHLRSALYEDYMALDMSLLTGGSLTNVAIETAKANLDLACNELETQTFDCIEALLNIIGKPEIYDEIAKYTRQQIANQQERIEMVYTTGLREDITRQKALELTGLFEADEIEQIIIDMDAEDVTGIDDAEKLMKKIGDMNA